jgi:hypothetical protein
MQKMEKGHRYNSMHKLSANKYRKYGVSVSSERSKIQNVECVLFQLFLYWAESADIRKSLKRFEDQREES